jgi:hypothetical protein
MADTPRGPRPTVDRSTARWLTIGWLVVLALMLVAAIAPRVMSEAGWSQQRVTIVRIPIGECSNHACTIRPLVRLHDGSTRHVTLRVVRDDERPPSAHLNSGGTLLLWVKHGESPRALRPIRSGAHTIVNVARWLIILLAAALFTAGRRAPRVHAHGRAGHVADHVARWVLAVIVGTIGILLLVSHQHFRTPHYEPHRSAGGTYGTLETTNS